MSRMGKLQIYTGDGKGKTTAALGLAIRAAGHGFKVGIIYFDKGGDFYGERKILDAIKSKNLSYKAFGEVRMVQGKGFRFKNNANDFNQATLAIDEALKWMRQDFDILILDEINTTVKTGLLKLDEILYLIGQKPEKLELILTGRYCPDKVMELADLITEMKPAKHYISTGLPARKGIEF